MKQLRLNNSGLLIYKSIIFSFENLDNPDAHRSQTIGLNITAIKEQKEPIVLSCVWIFVSVFYGSLHIQCQKKETSIRINHFKWNSKKIAKLRAMASILIEHRKLLKVLKKLLLKRSMTSLSLMSYERITFESGRTWVHSCFYQMLCSQRKI